MYVRGLAQCPIHEKHTVNVSLFSSPQSTWDLEEALHEIDIQ